MPKITFIGAGSTVFAKNLLGDILSFPELQDAEICLFDIDPVRLRTSEVVAHKIADFFGAQPRIEATADRRRALDGADYAISMFQVGGYKPGTVVDFEIPKKYGLRQTIADTLGIGGIMRGLRTIPVFLAMTADMEELCPDVTFLQYVNPMAMNCWAINRASTIKTVGLCHSVQGTAECLADGHGRAHRRDQLCLRGHQPHGLLPAFRAGWRGSLSRACGKWQRQEPLAGAIANWPTRCATRSSGAPATS